MLSKMMLKSVILILSGSFVLARPAVGRCQDFTVRDVDNPARQPFQIEGSVTIPDGQLGSFAVLTTVPAGKRLVIEFVSAEVAMPSGQQVQRFVISRPFFLDYAKLLMTRQATGGYDSFVGNHAVRIYADPGTDVSAGLSRSGTAAEVRVFVTLSGYFVDVP